MPFSKSAGGAAKILVAAGLCVSSSTAALANPCVTGVQGCVLPLPEPAAVAAATTPPIVDEVDEPKGFGGLLLPLLGVGLAALAAVLLLDDDEPESP